MHVFSLHCILEKDYRHENRFSSYIFPPKAEIYSFAKQMLGHNVTKLLQLSGNSYEM